MRCEEAFRVPFMSINPLASKLKKMAGGLLKVRQSRGKGCQHC